MSGLWNSERLCSLIEMIIDKRGVTPLKLGSSFSDNGHRVISAKNIKNRRVDLATGEKRYIDAATYAKWMKEPLEIGDVLLTSEAPLGEPAYISNPVNWVLGQRLFAIRTNPDKLLGQFLYYALQTGPLRDDLLSRATGSVAQGIRQSELLEVTVIYPEISEQRRIAEILGALDDKIELNRRMAATLEEIGRAIFKSWFVDFDPVRAKAEGRPTGLPPEIDALFPDSLQDSELGPIPQGWDVATLADVSKLNPESWTRQNRPPNLKYVDLSNTKWGRIQEVTDYSAAQAPSRAQRILRVGDTIVGTVRPGNGSYALIAETGLTGSTGFAVLRPLHCHLRSYVYLAATSQERIKELASLADGGAYPAVRPEVVTQTPVVIAPQQLFNQFERIAGSLMNRIASACVESEALATIRETLLPKLIACELATGDSP